MKIDSSKILINDDLVGQFVSALNKVRWVPGSAVGLGSLVKGELRGGVIFEKYTGVGGSTQLHVAGYGYWATPNFLWHVFHYCFEALKVFKILGIVDSGNIAACRFDEHIGFYRECVITGAGRNGSDLIVYSMTRDQCRWLGSENEPSRYTSNT